MRTPALLSLLLLAACSPPREASVRPPALVSAPPKVARIDTTTFVKTSFIVLGEKLKVLPPDTPRKVIRKVGGKKSLPPKRKK